MRASSTCPKIKQRSLSRDRVLDMVDMVEHGGETCAVCAWPLDSVGYEVKLQADHRQGLPTCGDGEPSMTPREVRERISDRLVRQSNPRGQPIYRLMPMASRGIKNAILK
jgi:hypothetical protein